MSPLRSSLIVTFFSSNGATAVFFLVTIVLARILSPAEIGIFSMAAVLVGIAHMFRDFGVSSYLLQEKELTPQMLRSALGVLYTASWTMAALLFATSDLIAGYMAQPSLRPVLQVLALGFVFIPFGSVSNTLLTREFRAKEQALAVAYGVVAYSTTVILLAYWGFGPMSMAWANLVNIIVCAIAYSFFRAPGTPWLPSFRGWSKAANFGGGAIIGGLVTQVNVALPDIMLGKLSGPHDVGILSRANATANIFMQIAGPAVNYAALPYLAQLHHKGESLKQTIGKACGYLTVCGWPPLMVVAVFPGDVILLLYGPKWIECAPVIRLLCLGACVGMGFNFHGAGLLAISRSYLAMLPNASLLILRLAAIFVLYDGTLHSFVVALIVAAIATVPANLLIQSRFFGMTNRYFFHELLPSLLVTLVCLGVAVALRLELPESLPVAARLLVVLALESVVWVAAILWFRHPIGAELARVSERSVLASRLLGGLRVLVRR